MRRAVGPAVLLLTLVAGCGDDDSTEMPEDRSASASAPSPSASVEAEVAGIVTATLGGGTVAEAAVPVGDETALAAFTDQLTNGLPRRIGNLVARTAVPEASQPYATVVAIGCEKPTAADLEIDTGPDGVRITLASPLPTDRECLAPMTSVAVVVVPDGALG